MTYTIKLILYYVEYTQSLNMVFIFVFYRLISKTSLLCDFYSIGLRTGQSTMLDDESVGRSKEKFHSGDGRFYFNHKIFFS